MDQSRPEHNFKKLSINSSWYFESSFESFAKDLGDLKEDQPYSVLVYDCQTDEQTNQIFE